MKQLKNVILGFGLVGLFGACGGEMDKLNDLADEMCKCKDAECVQKVGKKIEGLDKEGLAKDAKGKEKEFGELMGKIAKCSTEAAMGSLGKAMEEAASEEQ